MVESDLWIMVYVAIITKTADTHAAAEGANQAIVDFRDIFTKLYRGDDCGVDKTH